MRRDSVALSAVVCALSLISVSCSGRPAPPAAGSPAFYWSAALETYNSGDYLKTTEHLERLTRSANEFTVQAHPMRLAVLAGLMQGHEDLAEQYEYGARNNKANPTPFRKRVSDYRSMASREALQLGQAYAGFGKAISGGEVVLVFPFPPRGSLGMAPEMAKLAQGMMLAGAELETAQKAMIQRGVLLAVCQVTGSGRDAPKAQELLKAHPVKVARQTFLAGLAESLYDASVLFGEGKLNMPDRQQYFLQAAKDALPADASGAAKELRGKVEADLKKVGKKKG